MKTIRKCSKVLALLLLTGTLLTSCSSWYDEHLYYEDHNYPYEDMYKTVLADPSKVTKGKPLLALKENAYDWTDALSHFEKNLFGKYDVRFMDVSDQDLSVIENHDDVSFNSVTIWPEVLPNGFNPDEILEFNKNPGLGIRKLHEQGITGKGVGIAIIGQPLLTDHDEYKDNLMYYERIHCASNSAIPAGPFIASITVGKNVGIAPDAKLYYIASTFGHANESDTYEYDFTVIADCIYRVLEINSYLPEDEKIRIISIPNGYSIADGEHKGYKDYTAAVT